MTSFREVKEIVKFFKKNKFRKYVILQCTGNYPSKISDANLKVIKKYKDTFNCLVGYSDHTPDNLSSIASSVSVQKSSKSTLHLTKKCGGQIIECHYRRMI